VLRTFSLLSILLRACPALHLMGFRNCCWRCQSRKKLKEKKTKWKWKLWSFAEATKYIFVYISIYLAIKKLKCIWNMFY